MALDHIYSKHKHWTKIVQGFGIANYAEDIVQEAYIKVQGKEINEAYFYFILQSMSMDLHRKKVLKIPIEEVDGSYAGRGDLRIKPEVEEAYHFQAVKSRYDRIDTEKTLVKLHALMDTWQWYDRMLFTVWVNSGKTIRCFSRDIGIGFMSVYQTIRKCKNNIKQWQKENPNLED